ncbi:hypothetical protein ACSBR2_008974 [Camellia fascicularis]
MVGNVGFGKDDGIWVLGSGGNVGIVGKVGIAGIVGKVGTVGIVGNGGNVTFGSDGIAGTVWRRLRAAKLIWMLESDITMNTDRTKLH